MLPRLHVVTDDRVLSREDWAEVSALVLDAGAGRLALHVRGPGLSGRTIFERTEALIGSASRGATILVNDRVDVALSLRVDGVQLRETSLAVRDARRLLGPMRWIGASVHDAQRAKGADDEGADYLVVGTLFATPSHPERAGGGVELLAEVLATCELPLVAIGGVTPERARLLRDAGAYGVAVLGGVWQAVDAAAAVREYLHAIED
jgi:thiamine-phosphate diphosphorylase